jgi:hypothetical protein
MTEVGAAKIWLSDWGLTSSRKARFPMGNVMRGDHSTIPC